MAAGGYRRRLRPGIYDRRVEADPPQPTSAQLTYGLKLIRIAIAGSIAFIAVFTAIFLAFTDIPVVPLLPVAIFVIAFDLIFLAVITRSRRAAIERAVARESGTGAG
jgi:hypothetical protein